MRIKSALLACVAFAVLACSPELPTARSSQPTVPPSIGALKPTNTLDSASFPTGQPSSALPKVTATATISSDASASPVPTASRPIPSPNLEQRRNAMVARHPTANVLNPVLWLGCRGTEGVDPTGTGVVVHSDGREYLATALHVVNNCELNPWVRYNGRWNAIQWETVAVDSDNDIAILKTETVLDPRENPVSYGEPAGLIYGQIGYALGFPGLLDGGQLTTEHITEAEGKPIPLASLVVANFKSTGESTYSASYINAGFSGGAIVFPIANDQWTIAGVITHFPTVPRPVYRDGNPTGDYVMEHTGLVGYTPFQVVIDLVANSALPEK